MDWLRFSAFSIGNMTAFIILCVILVYLFKIKEKSRQSWFLLGYIVVLALLLLSYLLRYTIFNPVSFYTTEMSNLIVFGVLFCMLFAYHFPENRHPRESWIVPAVYFCAGSAAYISIIFSGKEIYSFIAHFFTREMDARIAIVAGFGYLWTIILFLRKAAIFSNYTDLQATEHQKPESVHSKPTLKHLAVRIIGTVIRMFWPKGALAKSLFTFALLTLVTFLICFSYFLSIVEIITRETYGLLFSNGALIVSLLIFIVYINNSTTPSSLRWKLVGVSLATILVLLGIAGNIIYTNTDASYDAQKRLSTKHVEAMLISRDFSTIPEYIVYIASRSRDGGLYSDDYEIVFSNTENITPESLVESDRKEKQDKLDKAIAALLNKDRNLGLKQALMSVETEIASKSVSEFQRRYRYIDMLNTETFYTHYDFIFRDRLYEVGFSYAQYRLEMHRILLQLVFLILGTTMLTLIIYPVFYRKSLLIPFKGLLDGIREVNRGSFDATVPVYIDDEIGFLSRSFNSMLEKLKSAFDAIKKREYEALHVIGRAAEFRDPETANHLIRVASYSKMLARLVGESTDIQDLIYYAAPLHDIGKIGVPDSVLLKNGRLSSDEFDMIKAHAVMGHDMLKDSTSSFLQAGAVIAMTHHEKFDGSGYPGGVQAEWIHVFGRIVAIADVFDALTTKRPYKDPWPVEKAIEVLQSERGKHFDPNYVDFFIANISTVLDIHRAYSD